MSVNRNMHWPASLEITPPIPGTSALALSSALRATLSFMLTNDTWPCSFLRSGSICEARTFSILTIATTLYLRGAA